MNIFGFEPNKKDEYFKYLLSIGFTEQKAKDMIKRMESNRTGRKEKEHD